jgi:hypothetical protein
MWKWQGRGTEGVAGQGEPPAADEDGRTEGSLLPVGGNGRELSAQLMLRLHASTVLRTTGLRHGHPDARAPALAQQQPAHRVAAVSPSPRKP